jgi:hypothetical protein
LVIARNGVPFTPPKWKAEIQTFVSTTTIIRLSGLPVPVAHALRRELL